MSATSQGATASKAITRPAWDEACDSYDEPIPDRDLEPVAPRGAGWSLVSSAANAKTLFWTWRRSTRTTRARRERA